MSRQRVMIATDLSERARIAETVGADLASRLDADVVLVHCYDPEPAVPPLAIPNTVRFEASIEREMLAAIEGRLEEIRARSLRGVKNVEIRALRTHSPAAEICHYAREHDVSWIVVGTHGRTGLRHMLIGSVAERVVRHAPCSVVVARQPPER